MRIYYYLCIMKNSNATLLDQAHQFFVNLVFLHEGSKLQFKVELAKELDIALFDFNGWLFHYTKSTSKSEYGGYSTSVEEAEKLITLAKAHGMDDIIKEVEVKEKPLTDDVLVMVKLDTTNPRSFIPKRTIYVSLLSDLWSGLKGRTNDNLAEDGWRFCEQKVAKVWTIAQLRKYVNNAKLEDDTDNQVSIKPTFSRYQVVTTDNRTFNLMDVI